MRNPTIKLTLAENYLLKHPELSKAALSRMLFRDYPTLYKDSESARDFIRHATGDHGKHGHDKVRVSDFKKQLEESRAQFGIEPYGGREYMPVDVEGKSVLVISDIHIGYENAEAVDLALEYGYNHNIDAIVINGDLFDFPTMGMYLVDSKAKDIEWEVQQGRQWLSFIREAFPSAKIYLHYGNHDERFRAYILRHADRLQNLSCLQLNQLLDLKSLNITEVDSRTWMNVGELKITHGHYVVRGSFPPVNIARGVYLKTGESTMIGHCHKISEHIESTMGGKIIGCWSTGCLSELKPSYSPQVSKYQLGFAHVMTDSVLFEVHNKKIIDGRIR